MRKKLNWLICLVLMVALTACSSGEGGSGTSTSSGNGTADSTTEGSSGKSDSGDSTGKNDNTQGNSGTTEGNNDSGTKTDEGVAAVSEIMDRYAGILEDELKWEYNSSSKTIVISGEGPMKNYIAEVPEWDVYADEAEAVVIGDKVTSVGDLAFWAFSNLQEVKLGEDVEYIGDSAFAYCYSLRTVNFPEKLKFVGTAAFVNALLHSDKGFVLPEGLEYVGEDAFFSAFKESYVSLPASLENIGKEAFANCYIEEFRIDEGNKAFASVDGIMYSKDLTTLYYYPSLKTDKLYEIPDTVKTIKEYALEVTRTLEKIVIPKSVSLIEEGAIYWNYALNRIDVDEANTAYKSEDGVLYTRDGKKLVCYPIASERNEYTVPEGTEEIFKYSFSQAMNLEKIHIKEGVKRIGEGAFLNCDRMVSAGLPKSLETIETYGFGWCEALTRINYASSLEDWEKITIGENNEILSSGIVYPEYSED